MRCRHILLLSLLLIDFSLLGQQPEKENFHYIFPDFINGTVLMKNGTKYQTSLNYNLATEEMIFEQDGQKLAMADITLAQLDTVIIQDRIFVLLDNKKFAEVIHKDGYKFLAQYRSKIIPPGKPAAYGGTSQTASTDSYSSWVSNGRMYQLKLPDDFKINRYTVYWLDNGAGWKSFSSMGQIKKFYNKRKRIYDEYAKANKVNFKDQESVVGLIHYMEMNSK